MGLGFALSRLFNVCGSGSMAFILRTPGVCGDGRDSMYSIGYIGPCKPLAEGGVAEAARRSAECYRRAMSRLTLRLDLGPDVAVGPGKVRLLELIGERGSISAAGRAMDMSYRRAWLLVDELNRSFSEPLVSTQLGGAKGGGAELTPFGRRLVDDYRAMEREAAAAVAKRMRRIERAMAKAADKV
jgi:molybdate transport system regulatory protein